MGRRESISDRGTNRRAFSRASEIGRLMSQGVLQRRSFPPGRRDWDCRIRPACLRFVASTASAIGIAGASLTLAHSSAPRSYRASNATGSRDVSPEHDSYEKGTHLIRDRKFYLNHGRIIHYMIGHCKNEVRSETSSQLTDALSRVQIQRGRPLSAELWRELGLLHGSRPRSTGWR